MDELGEQISDVVIHFDLKTFIGFGVGVGANILVRFALAHPERVTIKQINFPQIARNVVLVFKILVLFYIRFEFSFSNRFCVK